MRAAVLFLLIATAAAAEPAPGTLGAVVARKTLRVGMYPGLVPFVAAGPDAEMLRALLGERAPPVRHASDGQPVCGLDVELAAEAAHALHVALEITLVDKFDDLLPGLRAGRYDVAISGLTRTLDRAVEVAFSDAYFTSGLQVLVRERDAARFGGLDQVKQAGVRVAARHATTAETFARTLGAAEVRTLSSVGEVMAALDAGTVDAAVVDYVSARDAEVRGKLKNEIVPVEGRRFTSEQFAFAVRHGDADWLGWLNLFLRQQKTGGAFHRQAARFNDWFRAER